MLKWMLTLVITVLMVGLFAPRLRRWLGRRRLPGDLSLRIGGRDYDFPFATVLVLSLLATLVFKWL